MEGIREHQMGTFSWIDLATKDSAAAKTFYSELFGYSVVDTPAGPDMVYTMLNLGENAVAGLYQMNQEMMDQGIPPHWVSYVTVGNVDEIMEKAKSLSATVIQEAFDVFDAGRMGIIQDPTGAVLSLWQPKAHMGLQIRNVPGTLCWNELATIDTEKARAFYTGLFGWKSETSEMIRMTYTSFKIGKKPVAGMYEISPEMGDIPSNWMPYIAVEDCGECVKKAQDLGGQLIQPPTDIPGTGRFSVLQDPQAAVFGVIKMEPIE